MRIDWMTGVKYFLITLLVFQGCTPNMYQPLLSPSEAKLGNETAGYSSLTALPAPKEKIVAAVYKFRDQTGQYKPSEFFQNFSTAITQGATSILLRALEESDWFLVIERENLNNLLNERKIIRSSRAQYSNEKGQIENDLLPPLLFAGVILEGGIISYDANVITGGAGLRYFGAGASGQYREDKITVYLRAISTSNGRILKTVYTSKTILSQMVDVGLFRFVKFKRLLEVETGFTHNEPTQMAVTEAIEKAVESLIIEGVFENLWTLADTSALRSPIMKDYIEEKEDNEKSDSFGRMLSDRRRKMGLGLNFGAELYDGDYKNAIAREVGSMSFHWAPNAAATISASVGRGYLATDDFYDGTYDFAELCASFHFFPRYRFTPSFYGGVGMLKERSGFAGDDSDGLYTKLMLGLNVEYLIWDNLGINVSFDGNQILNDRIDGLELGSYNDVYWRGMLGLNFYFGSKLK
jgi:curli production assembly/transport component CsgG